MPETKPTIKIRPALPEDAARLAELCAQLGYPSTKQVILSRLNAIGLLPDHLILVAVDPGSGPVGWVHAFVYRVLESDQMVEIGGLVVDQLARGQGVGQALLNAVEDWTIAQDIDIVSLRSNSLRTEAHEFYRHQGYTVPKTQLVFRKRVRLDREIISL